MAMREAAKQFKCHNFSFDKINILNYIQYMNMIQYIVKQNIFSGTILAHSVVQKPVHSSAQAIKKIHKPMHIFLTAYIPIIRQN